MHKTLPEWLNWLESLHPKDIELGLGRISVVAERLGIYSRLKLSQSKVITVAGTNGKGSCVATMEAFALDAKKSVGAYTSPHFLKFNERIRINGQMVADEDLVHAFCEIEKARNDTSLTYFEYTTLAAFWLFCEAELDVWLLEVGLGGRLDAVNIIDSDVAVITSIALDHQDWLGDNREDIGREKAGIMRASRPVICVDVDPPESIRKYAEEVNACLQLIDETLNWSDGESVWCCQIAKDPGPQSEVMSFRGLSLPNLPIPSVVAGLQALRFVGLHVEQQSVIDVLQKLELTGRNQQRTVSGRRFILDVAHNPAAANLLAQRLSVLENEVVAIFAVMSDKDIPGILTPLYPYVDHWLVADLGNNPRAAKGADLAETLERGGQDVSLCGTVRQAIERSLSETSEGDSVIIFGSFYTVADALTAIETLPAIVSGCHG